MVPDDLKHLRKLYLGFIASRVILTANNLGIFDSLKRVSSAAEVAEKLGINKRATEILLDALTGIGLLKKSRGGRYRNSHTSNLYLVKSSRLYQGYIIKHASTMWANFSALDEVVKTGRSARRGFDYESFIMGMHNLTILRTKHLMKALSLRGIKTMLDLGGGPGTNAIAMARKGIKATVFDLPETITIARKVARRAGVKGIRFIAGDFHADSIGSGYDLILLSQIFHAYAEEDNIAILRKCKEAVNSGGKVVVQDFPISDNLTSPPQSALFSVNMLVGTDRGRCYSPKEMKHWLANAGFRNIVVKYLPETVLVIGERKE